MAFEKLTTDVANISKLDNYPPDDSGMTPNKLKALFDKGSVDIKSYINNTLLPQLELGYIQSVTKAGTGAQGTTDIYTITYQSGDIYSFSVYNGIDGADGVDGREVDIQRGDTHIQWRYSGDASWTDLLAMSDIKGDKGDTGNGIASAILNEDYTLTLTFTNGFEYTTPSIRGEQGIQGIRGVQGLVGNGIYSATLNEDYTLTITFTNGSHYTSPPIRGKEGTDGKDGKDAELPFDIWAGSLAEYNALPYEQRNDPEFVHCIYEE